MTERTSDESRDEQAPPEGTQLRDALERVDRAVDAKEAARRPPPLDEDLDELNELARRDLNRDG